MHDPDGTVATNSNVTRWMPPTPAGLCKAVGSEQGSWTYGVFQNYRVDWVQYWKVEPWGTQIGGEMKHFKNPIFGSWRRNFTQMNIKNSGMHRDILCNEISLYVVPQNGRRCSFLPTFQDWNWIDYYYYPSTPQTEFLLNINVPGHLNYLP